MNHLLQHRHLPWYERLLFSGSFQFVLGMLLIVVLPALQRWPEVLLSAQLNDNMLFTISANALTYCIIFSILRRLRHFPGAQTIAYVLPVIALAWLLAVAILFFTRLDYSRQVLLVAYAAASLWAVAGVYIRKRYRAPRLALVPIGRALTLENNLHAYAQVLERPDLQTQRFDIVVADLHSSELTPEWERFLARCTLSQIPVFHVEQIEELLTGRVRIEHLVENEIGSLVPSPLYSALKRIIDFFASLVLLPFLIPVMLFIALWIKYDSKGPVLFVQQRLGFKGRLFKVYKFRSMYTHVEGKSFTEGQDDPRITPVGRIIRKFRIDELPQVINVLKGDMSFIGPRPESKALADWYEEVIPFFAYRHVVRPGISGWAQVNQGYAAEIDGMTRKLQYDFYYIKHFSIWLDILIVFKTIKTLLTGFGAR